MDDKLLAQTFLCDDDNAILSETYVLAKGAVPSKGEVPRFKLLQSDDGPWA